MIVTLAGHVDHGKTSLVKALTGVNTDKLKEETLRGLTIDLGFAYSDSGKLGFVDVPGHKKFIHNMVAGVAADQHAMLVVAADDGIMPQTREHLEILSLIGLKSGCVVITKTDRADEDRLSAVTKNVKELTKNSFLNNSEFFYTSIEEPNSYAPLQEHLVNKSAEDRNTESQKPFRMAIDRVFSLKGVGLVVTGTVHSGRLTKDQAIFHFPSGQESRVRGIRVNDKETETTQVGERCALNITGINQDELKRGDWLDSLQPSGYQTVTGRLRISEDFPRTVKHWTPVHVYQATSHYLARVAMRRAKEIKPGGSAQVDILLEEKMHCYVGDKFVLRDQSLDLTLGGGEIVFAEKSLPKRRNSMRRAQIIESYETGTPSTCFDSLLEIGPVDMVDFCSLWQLTTQEGAALTEGKNTRLLGGQVISEARWGNSKEALISVFKANADKRFRENELPGAKDTELKLALLNELVRENTLEVTGGQFKLKGAVVSLSPQLEKFWQLMEPKLQVMQAPSSGDLSKTLKVPQTDLEKALNELVKNGLLINVAKHRYYPPSQLSEIAKEVIELGTETGFSVADFRDVTKIGRNVAIEILEYFDNKGFTRRDGNSRKVFGKNPFE